MISFPVVNWSKSWSSPGRSFRCALFVPFLTCWCAAVWLEASPSEPQWQQINLTCWVCRQDPVWFLCPRIFFVEKKCVYQTFLFVSVLNLHFVLSDISAVACFQFGFIWSSFSLWILLVCNFPLFMSLHVLPTSAQNSRGSSGPHPPAPPPLCHNQKHVSLPDPLSTLQQKALMKTWMWSLGSARQLPAAGRRGLSRNTEQFALCMSVTDKVAPSLCAFDFKIRIDLSSLSPFSLD